MLRSDIKIDIFSRNVFSTLWQFLANQIFIEVAGSLQGPRLFYQ
jgi:hypothetical protein